MNRYIMLRRLRWPAILLLAGIVALLCEMGVVSHFMRVFIPLLLIMLGVLLLAERAVLAADGGIPPYPGDVPGAYPGTYPGAPYQPGPYQPGSDPLAAAAPPQPPASPGTSMVPSGPHDLIHNSNSDSGTDREGGQS